MPPDLGNLERRLTPEADPDDGPIGGEIGLGSSPLGAVQANGPTLLCHLERVRRLLVVDDFTRERMPLPIAEHHHALLEVDVLHRTNVQAKSLLEPARAKRLRRLDGLPFARQQDRPGDGLLDGARLHEQQRHGKNGLPSQPHRPSLAPWARELKPRKRRGRSPTDETRPVARENSTLNCWGSFFATLKKELVRDQTFETRASARSRVFEYIEHPSHAPEPSAHWTFPRALTGPIPSTTPPRAAANTETLPFSSSQPQAAPLPLPSLDSQHAAAAPGLGWNSPTPAQPGGSLKLASDSTRLSVGPSAR